MLYILLFLILLPLVCQFLVLLTYLVAQKILHNKSSDILEVSSLPSPLTVEGKQGIGVFSAKIRLIRVDSIEESRPPGKTTTRVARRLIGNALDLPLDKLNPIKR